ncbi:MAG TPA: hypothetical protein VMR08_03835 [Patescibacteria group bacterium]|jgi:pimeloyl-ACP methyl ester carboxylesterase|nr:hypothetical protein [Patescibacteria group bacterium]
MKQIPKQDPADYIVTLNMNGLKGRMLNLPAVKRSNNEILFVYGNHSVIEEWFEFLIGLSQYGNVTMPDLPGFGGMQSIFRVNEKPTVDNLAGYLASFIKLKYKRRRITIFAADLGFVVVTRMLQQYPEIARKIKLLVGIDGFARYDDLNFSHFQQFMFKITVKIISTRILSVASRLLLINQTVIRQTHKQSNRGLLLNRLTANAFNKSLENDIHLWKVNDLRTHAFTVKALLSLDNCQSQLKVPTWNIIFNPRYFIRHSLNQHLHVAYPGIIIKELNIKKNNYKISAAMLEAILSRKLKRLLSQS